MDKIQVDILGLSSSPSAGGAYALLLKETDGIRRLPIIIGAFEAQSIALELEGIKPPRPLTHDLLKNLVDDLGATVLEIFISELRENTFYAKIIIESSSLTNTIDARPSDAIALAVRTGSPIYIAADVLNSAGFAPSEEAEEGSEQLGVTSKYESGQPPRKTAEAKVASIHDQLREAVEKEDYERAAKLRDEINRLKGNN
ncbi:MAG: bifunctional nuclease family protein [Melioribacteraceae bacterium]